MYLKRLVLHGFKSFADRTVIELEPGVTGIVGPNGCGKSNVADAIKWVLGEQSPKSLRASSMQDVLFEGTDSRPPMAFSEVSLLFTECEKELGTEFHEVEISRRVEREGPSDYFLNGKSCRLKDIQQLFRDTGIGRVAYSFLQQGQIDRLLSTNPIDRRIVFEEAAGVSGFRAKREETLRKLSEVEANLARLSDILSEVLSQMGSLKRQASRAVRAARLKRMMNALDLAIVGYDLENLETQIARKSAEIAPLEGSLATAKKAFSDHEDSLRTFEGEMSGLLDRQQSLSNAIFEKRSAREEALSHERFMGLRTQEARERGENIEKDLEALKAEEREVRFQTTENCEHLEAAERELRLATERVAELASAHEAGQKASAAAQENQELLRARTSGVLQGAVKSLQEMDDSLRRIQSPLEQWRSNLPSDDELAAVGRVVKGVSEKTCSTHSNLEELLKAHQSHGGESSEKDTSFAALAEARLSEARAQHALEVAQEGGRNLERRMKELSGRLESSLGELERLRADGANYAAQALENKNKAEALKLSLAEMETQLQEARTKIDAQEQFSAAVRAEREKLHEAVNAAQGLLMKATLEARELSGRKALLTDDLKRRYGEGFASREIRWREKLFEAAFFAKADESSLELGAVKYPPADELALRYQSLDRDQVSTECQTMRAKLEGIGPINESALEDYKTHEMRHNTLKAQVDDLHAAKAELANALQELEGQSAALFTEAFLKIRENFSKTFERLFGGGKSDLLLENPADPLNSGIEIMARPPGTQLRSLGLLSGGQKTMAAVALLFAIYQVKPSPFCVLDELDAPLDDANIGRFLEMLKDFTAWSQFVIITHNRRTMASANILYGVTMQDRGVSRIISMRLSQAEVFSKPVSKAEPEDANAIPSETLEANVEAAAEAVSGYSLDGLKARVATALATESGENAEEKETQAAGS